jgi:hypothetical protein
MNSYDSTKIIEVLSPKARIRIYLIFAAVSGLIGATMGGFSAVGWQTPDALVFASSFVSFLGVFFGITAANNVNANITTMLTATPSTEGTAREFIDTSTEGDNFDEEENTTTYVNTNTALATDEEIAAAEAEEEVK